MSDLSNLWSLKVASIEAELLPTLSSEELLILATMNAEDGL